MELQCLYSDIIITTYIVHILCVIRRHCLFRSSTSIRCTRGSTQAFALIRILIHTPLGYLMHYAHNVVGAATQFHALSLKYVNEMH